MQHLDAVLRCSHPAAAQPRKVQEVGEIPVQPIHLRWQRDQVAGNIEVLLCGRQNMPASAELVAAIAGTRGAWITIQQTHAPAAGLLTGLGSRSRGREYVVHPDTIKRLDVGEFVVIEPRLGRAVIVRVFHPDELRRHGVEC